MVKAPVDVKPDCTQTSSLFCIGFLILYSSNMYGDEIYLCNKAGSIRQHGNAAVTVTKFPHQFG
ncbi:hypothetical protein BANRA_03665 [Acinetobacter baumannii]|nr:hypothetical protein BANRA_03665 [Acinetobacter baumannii]